MQSLNKFIKFYKLKILTYLRFVCFFSFAHLPQNSDSYLTFSKLNYSPKTCYSTVLMF